MRTRHPFLGLLILLALMFDCRLAWSQKVGGLVPMSKLPTATAIAKPTLTAPGGQLVFSDSPEQLVDSGLLPGAMYRDQLIGQFRVFFHHQNVTSGDVRVGVAITNSTSQPEFLFGRGEGVGINIYPDVAGQTALAEFISSKGNISLLALLLPGESYWATQTVPPGSTGSGILQYLVITIPATATAASLPSTVLQSLNAAATEQDEESAAQLSLPPGYDPGTATVTTLAYDGARPTSPVALPVLAGDGNVRGTFPHYNRAGAFSLLSTGGLQSLDIETSPPGQPYSDDMPGEYELGTDAVDGGIQVYDDGNYGVLYDFRITIVKDPATHPLPFAIMMNPAGGSGHYVIRTNGHLALSDYVDYTSAWWFEELQLQKASTVVHLVTSLTGGSDGPQVLMFDPGFAGN
jgi:hypothetical protein